MRIETRRVMAAATALTMGVALAACGGDKAEAPVATGGPAVTPTPTPTVPQTHPFTGGTKGLRNPVLAVKIDNTRPAHPQQGLRSADIVYVEQVEGGETRIMAVFSSKIPASLGPVRSARISDLHILRQFGKPAFAFSGVQGKMKPYVRRAPLFDLSQDAGVPDYFRVAGRPMPYNLFTRPKALLKKAPKASAPRDIGFRFGPAPEGGKATRSFTAVWPSETMSFRWSAKDKRWLSSHGGRTNSAAEGGVLGGETVVIQYAKTERSQFHDFLGSYTPLIHTTGTGKAVVLRDGRSYVARWSRPSESAGTSFTVAANGQPMTFAPGQVWVVLVNEGKPRIP